MLFTFFTFYDMTQKRK